jgi:hypothetical protein
MLETLTGLTVLAAEGIPPGSPLAVLSVPIGILVLLGSIYLLVRSNLGTRRGYLVMGSSLFGFLFIMSLFWTFGAPGTPQATGPRNLPSQLPNEYQPTWTPFAQDSRIADLPEYQLVQSYPEGFGEVPEDFTDEAEAGASDTQTFFADEAHGEVISDIDEVESIEYAEAENGFPVVAVTYLPVDPNTFEVVEDGEPVTLFAFFDEGNPIFPGLVFIALSLLLFAIHAVLLFFDEGREAREASRTAEEVEREPVSA